MPAVIDHTAYPHIIDRIVAAASPPALLRLRATSKAFHDRVLGLIAHSELTTVVHTSDDLGTPQLRSLLVSPAATHHRLLPFLESSVKILDIMGQSPSGPHNHHTLGHFTRAHTVRRGNRAWELQAIDFFPCLTTVVDFVDLLKEVTRGDTFLSMSLPRQAPRAIIHIKYDTSLLDHLRQGIPFGFPSKRKTQELTIVLWPTAPGDEEPCQEQLQFLDSCLVSLLARWRGESKISFTIVGMNSVPNTQRPKELWKLVSKLKEAISSFRFITLDDWHQELGNEKDLVGVWPLTA
ncbi:hypothetical protein Q8F55_000055 [Vanrija albida]|uniref:F-box domain-containing protein n=1 Tax=Vanrija albida TaxID=181172 RepID=A0ABR3QC68_9TREE